MSEVCSACAFRYENNNIEKIQKCCYETCPQFDLDCKQECNKCLDKVQQKCTKNCTLSTEPFPTSSTVSHFMECMEEKKQDPREALRCCLKRCGTDFEAQEKCIDAYNSLRPVVYEDFRLPPSSQPSSPSQSSSRSSSQPLIESEKRLCFEPSLIVLVFSVLFHLLILGRSIELPQNRFYAFGTILLFYFTLYLYIQWNK